ncbi:hypothetical protein AFERRI_100050 [Acidithiobacillus ferrivorans]|uniref:Uncharacterized protein n=2 Tax=Acidithiobacillus ferrivorans TaxID=160808 RepID=A0A060UJC8_9PROT|nr:hypothetical protein AFERRI_100050 [Acidithiobacillus ferrivorans]
MPCLRTSYYVKSGPFSQMGSIMGFMPGCKEILTHWETTHPTMLKGRRRAVRLLVPFVASASLPQVRSRQ